MKKPYELEDEVMEKYFSISEERAKECLIEMEKKINESGEEYYLCKRIDLGENNPLEIQDEHLTETDRCSQQKELIKRVIYCMAKNYLNNELKKAGWKMELEYYHYYLKSLEES